MGSPFTRVVKPANPITDRQLDWLCDLQKKILELDAWPDIEEYMRGFTAQAEQLSAKEASQRIDLALAQLRELENLKRSQINVTDAVEEDIDGFWELTDGTIVKVQIAVHGSGKPYGKLLNTDSGRFEYTHGIVSRVRKEGTRLTLERAKELGHLYGLCIRCGATLTDEASIEAGIGPICAAKW